MTEAFARQHPEEYRPSRPKRPGRTLKGWSTQDEVEAEILAKQEQRAREIGAEQFARSREGALDSPDVLPESATQRNIDRMFEEDDRDGPEISAHQQRYMDKFRKAHNARTRAPEEPLTAADERYLKWHRYAHRKVSGEEAQRALRPFGIGEESLPLNRSPHRPFNVYLKGKLIDTVFYSGGTNVDNDEVRRSLINHDGYDPAIVVREERKRR